MRSCIPGCNHRNDRQSDLKIVETDKNNPKHIKIISSVLQQTRILKNYPDEKVKVFFVSESQDLNAASFGNGTFLFWETVADLPQWALDSVVAHEMSHDLLFHSRNISELQDFMNVIAQVFGFIGHADVETEDTLKEWSSKLTLPKYSRTQELEADSKSTEVLSLLGYKDPYEIAYKTIEILLNTYGESGGGFFDSHPATSERISLLKGKEDQTISDFDNLSTKKRLQKTTTKQNPAKH